MSGWKFFSRYEIAWDQDQLWMVFTDHNDRRLVVKPLEFEPGERYVAPKEPSLGSFEFSRAEAPRDVRGFLQAALDAAWEMGLRPKGFADHANELTAVRYHLEDMRALAKIPARPKP